MDAPSRHMHTHSLRSEFSKGRLRRLASITTNVIPHSAPLIQSAMGNLFSMQSACSSSYNPILLPAVYTTCVAAAQEYYVAVVAYASAYPNALPSIEQEALARSRNMQVQVVNNACGTTVEATTLYDPSLISLVDSNFQRYAHRLPTIYEFFDAVNAGNLVSDNANWQGLLVGKAVSAASVHTPAYSHCWQLFRRHDRIRLPVTGHLGRYVRMGSKRRNRNERSTPSRHL